MTTIGALGFNRRVRGSGPTPPGTPGLWFGLGWFGAGWFGTQWFR